MKVGKPKSKRTPVRLRHKIEKASAAKQRKQRKLAKKDPQWRSRLKKDPGIPNLAPYKDKILQDIEEKRRQNAEEARRKREGKVENVVSQVDVNDTTEAPQTEDIDIDLEEENDGATPSSTTADPMSALVESARARAQEYDSERLHSDDESENQDEMEEDTPGGVSLPSTSTQSNPSKNFDPSLRAHASTFHNVLSSASIFLYVLDARDPLSTRSKSIERQIAAADGGSKRLILVLNKIDLIPPEVLKEWLIHLRRFHPTLPLRATSSAPNAKTYDHKALTAKGTLEALLRALKATAQKSNAKGSTTVGILGYPNVGKSSVINGLANLLSRKGAHNNKNGSACPTGAEAGITTHIREVKIDNKLKILDAPGIIFPSDDSHDENHPSSSSSCSSSTITLKNIPASTKATLALLSALPPKSISDPIPAIMLLISRFQALDPSLSSLLSTYNIPALSASTTTISTSSSTSSSSTAAKDLTTPFLVEVARKKGRLGKGGVPNLNAAAMCVLGDWRDGRLVGGWVVPPKRGRSEDGMQGGAAEMDIDDGGGGDGEEVLEGKGTSGDDEMIEETKVVKEWGEEFKIEGLWD